MKQWQKILGVIAVCVLASGQVAAKVVLAKNAQQYATGQVSGKVDAIMNSMALSAEERTRMLELELRNARQLKANALIEHIEAHLGFARRRHEQLRSLIVPSEFTSDAFVKYCVGVVHAAAPFSDTSDVPGFASISEERQRSITSRAKRAQKKNEVAQFFGQVQRVHENVSRLIFADKKTSAMTYHFIEAFTTHMKDNYGIATVSMREEIAFRVLDVLVDAQPTDSRHIADVVGAFLDTYNTYVTEDNKITANELNVLYFGWPKLITTVESSSKHIMLLLSFSMERLKHAVKAQAEMRTRQEELVAKAKEAAEKLKQAGVAIDQARFEEPVYVQNQCAIYTNKVITVAGGQDKLSAADRVVVEQFTNLSSQLNKLSADYEAVVRQQADSEAVRSAHAAYDQLPANQQAQLSDLIQGPPMEGADVYGGGKVPGLPGHLTQHMHAHNKQNSLLTKIIPVAVAAGAVIAYDQAVKYARRKESDGSLESSKLAPVLRFLSTKSTPLEASKKTMEKVRAKLGLKPKKEVEPAAGNNTPEQHKTSLPGKNGSPSGAQETSQEAAQGAADFDELTALPPAGERPSPKPVVIATGSGTNATFVGVTAAAGSSANAQIVTPAPSPENEAPLISSASGQGEEPSTPPPASTATQQPSPEVPASVEVPAGEGDDTDSAEESPLVPPTEQPLSRPGGADPVRTVKKNRALRIALTRMSSPKKKTREEANVYGRALQELAANKSLKEGEIGRDLRHVGLAPANWTRLDLIQKLHGLKSIDVIGSEYIDWIYYHAGVKQSELPAAS